MGKLIELIADDEAIPYRHPGVDGTITIRRLTIDVRNEIHRRYQKIEHRNGRRESFIPETAVPDVERDLWDYIVLGWDGVVGKPGTTEPAPCTRETKFRLPDTIRQGILALADEANLSGFRNGSEPPGDPTRA